MRQATETAKAGRVLASIECGGTLVRITLDRPKGNIIDGEMIAELREVVRRVARTGQDAGARREEGGPKRAEQPEAGGPGLRTILIEGAGAHFSFGASVEEHREETVADLLGSFHDLFREMAASGRVVLAAVRGCCLGGGLEVAAFAHRIFAAPDAKLGCPEIKLGVFAPAASFLLPERVGQRHADDLLLTGRTVEADEALRMGLVDEIAPDPAAAAVAWHEKHLLPLSGAALARAVAAARHRFHLGMESAIRALERRYVDQVAPSADAREGIAAFIVKRKPVWREE